MERWLAVLVKLAWRNLWRNKRRTLIILSAISVGVWAMIFMTALMRGMVDQMIRNATESFIGHVQIHNADYINDPSIANSMAPPSADLIKYLDQAQAWTTRVRVPAVVSSERETRGVTLLGVAPQREAQLSFVAHDITSGRFLTTDDDNGVVIGEKLARKLDTELGKRVVIMSQDPENNIADRGVRVVGIYKAPLTSIEERFVIMGIATAQSFLKMGNRISEIEIDGDDYRNVEPLYQQIKQHVDSHLEVLTWQQLDEYLGSMLGMMDGFVLVWILVIFIALSFGLVNTLFMAVFERVREVGLILALGMRPAHILLQILFEALFLIILGLVIGTALSWLAIKPLEDGFDVSVVAQGMDFMGVGSVMYPALYLDDILLANVVVIVLGILASILPAWKAAQYKPVEAMTKT